MNKSFACESRPFVAPSPCLAASFTNSLIFYGGDFLMVHGLTPLKCC